ncbi:hypothetical protein [Orientia tsutsugamushi]|nr:hypothetical protein [Orientia tsutsugamushi]
MKDIYSAVVSMVNNVTSNSTFSHVKACLLSPRAIELFIKTTNNATKYYEICKSIFIYYPLEDLYNYKGVKVLHQVKNCGKQICLDYASLTVPGNLTSGINGKDIVITGLFNNIRDNNNLYDRLQKSSKGVCKIIADCDIDLIVKNINMMDDSDNENTTAVVAGTVAGIAVGVIVTSLIGWFFCRRSKKNDCVVVKQYTDENSNPTNFDEKVTNDTNYDDNTEHMYEEPYGATRAETIVEMSV